MSYDTKAILKDAQGKPIPQYYDPITDSYHQIEGANGSMKLMIVDSTGIEMTQSEILGTLITAFASLESKIDELIGVVS